MGQYSPNRIKPLAGTLRPENLSLSALLEARESLRKSGSYRARNTIRSQAAAKPGAKRKARNTRKKRNAEAIARKRVPGKFHGTYMQRKGLLPETLAVVAAWPDHPATISEARERCPVLLGSFSAETVRAGFKLVLKNGWSPIAESRWEGKYVNHTKTHKAPIEKLRVLSEEGRAVRAWAWWIAARRMMGWPLPMTGTQDRWVKHWIRGEPIPASLSMQIAAQVPGRPHGYLPGQGPDEEWPDLGKFAL